MTRGGIANARWMLPCILGLALGACSTDGAGGAAGQGGNLGSGGVTLSQTNGASPGHGQFIVNWMRQ